MAKKVEKRRVYDEDFKREAVQMLLDGHSAKSVAERLGISCSSIVRRWKSQQLAQAGPVALCGRLSDGVDEIDGRANFFLATLQIGFGAIAS